MSTDIFATGKLIGSGYSRVVYASARYPNRVVKHTCGDENRREAEIWRNANRYLRKYLARVYAISEDGSLMLMERTRPISRRELRKLLIPACLNWDAHRGNFGRLPDGRVVMHDYAYVQESPTTAGRKRSVPDFA